MLYFQTASPRLCHPSVLRRPLEHRKAAVADRLYASAEVQTALLKSREEARVAKELAACTFRPDTSGSSKRWVFAALCPPHLNLSGRFCAAARRGDVRFSLDIWLNTWVPFSVLYDCPASEFKPLGSVFATARGLLGCHSFVLRSVVNTYPSAPPRLPSCQSKVSHGPSRMPLAPLVDLLLILPELVLARRHKALGICPSPVPLPLFTNLLFPARNFSLDVMLSSVL